MVIGSMYIALLSSSRISLPTVMSALVGVHGASLFSRRRATVAGIIWVMQELFRVSYLLICRNLGWSAVAFRQLRGPHPPRAPHQKQPGPLLTWFCFVP